MSKSKLKFATLVLAAACVLGTTEMTVLPSATVYAAEASNETASVAEMLKNQQPDGGWRKNYKTTSGDWAKSTIDNGATYTEIRKLAAEYAKTKDSKYSAAALKGINFLIGMQYANGGWPQIKNSSGYHKHITFNDDAMINVMTLLNEVAYKKGSFSFVDKATATKANIAVAKGVDNILKTQIKVNGKLTAWGQQHDSVTLAPAGARAYEVPSLCAKESVTIVKFLKTRPSTPQIAASIKAAEDWFRATKITGIKVVKENGDVVVKRDSKASPVWARFYQIGTNKPIFVNRKSEIKYNLSEIEKERRTGYSWYGSWPSSLIK